MADFETWRAFQFFRQSVGWRSRYVRKAEAEGFLAIILKGTVERERNLPKGYTLWRAQLGSTWGDDPEHPGPEGYRPKRMKPRRGRATEGRVNPKGIPVLYLATTKETAMAEVRPWKGSDISLAQFKVMRALTIVDFSTDGRGRHFFFNEPDGPARDAAVWADIDRAFSAPTEKSDDGSEYVATQVISDAIRSAGYDGLAYQSGLEEGHNIALFDLDSADLINCGVWDLSNLTFEFTQAGNSYAIRKHQPDEETKPPDEALEEGEV